MFRYELMYFLKRLPIIVIGTAACGLPAVAFVGFTFIMLPIILPLRYFGIIQGSPDWLIWLCIAGGCSLWLGWLAWFSFKTIREMWQRNRTQSH